MALPSSIIQRGTRASQPSAASVAAGTLYFVTDETVLERSSGAAWETFSASTTLASTYTPTLTSVANVDSSTAYSCQYLRVGATVTVSGKLDVNATDAPTTVQLGIALPVSSNLANAHECAGTAVATGNMIGTTAAIIGDATNNRAELQFSPSYLLDHTFFFTFVYRVI